MMEGSVKSGAYEKDGALRGEKPESVLLSVNRFASSMGGFMNSPGRFAASLRSI